MVTPKNAGEPSGDGPAAGARRGNSDPFPDTIQHPLLGGAGVRPRCMKEPKPAQAGPPSPQAAMPLASHGISGIRWRRRISYIGYLDAVKASAKHRPSQRGRALGDLWGARDGRGRTPARRRPFLARPGVMVGAPRGADARQEGQAAARGRTRQAARRLTMSPGESEISVPSPTPQGSPGVCLRRSGLLGRRTPGPSPSSPGGRAGALWAFSSITCDHCFEAPGSQAHQIIRGPSL
jgi:hypothetical protein